MRARQISIVPVSLVVSGLWVLLSVGSLDAAGNCALTAPATVKVGDPLDIVGSGFPATTSVDVVLKVEGGPGDDFSVQSNASGGLQISLTPEVADVGVTTVTATAGSTCTATATFTVVGTNSPAPTATASSGSSGSAAGASAKPGGPPRTDTLSASAGAPGGPSPTPWLLGVLSLVIGMGGLLATRPVRNR